MGEETFCPPQEDEPPSTISGTTGSQIESFQLTSPITFEKKPKKLQADKPRRTYAGVAIGAATRAFMRRFHAGVSTSDWNDWRWQVANRITSLDGLARIINLTDEERSAILRHRGGLPISITPYYASLIDPIDPMQAVRRATIPVGGEYVMSPGEADDPLGEDHDSPVPGLVHRYPDRALFLVTGFCSTYCRYCTRSRMVGDHGSECFGREQWDAAISYIEQHREIRDVLLSGGDPLTMSDDTLDYLLGRLRRIEHVEFVRIGTKTPTVLPQRITRDLTRVLKKYHPLWISIHFMHPAELTTETVGACARLADAGIPLGSQTVLLKGVNDDVETMKKLMHGLLKARVKPYYLYQCDPISGSGHFRTSVEKGLEIIRGLRGHTTGYAVPSYVIDAPGGGGKIPLLPDYCQGRDGDDIVLKNYENKTFRYPDPKGCAGA